MQAELKLLFSDFFLIDDESLEKYGAYNISLVADLPLFIDPFRLFNSNKSEYQELHSNIISYLKFLRDKSQRTTITKGLLKSLYTFKEVKQNWFGFSLLGNGGSALGEKFATALNENFYTLFDEYGEESITKGSHLEKLCLIKEGVGRDNISDFTTNLIKEFLLKYTQTFALSYIEPKLCRTFWIERVKFNYQTETWEDGTFYLPSFNNDYVILTPKDILTKDENWINRPDLTKNIDDVINSVSDEELRAKINNYFHKVLKDDATKEERKEASEKVIKEFPELIDYYIRDKEEHGDIATQVSENRVQYSESVYLAKTKELIKALQNTSEFFEIIPNTLEETLVRAHLLKHFIENNDGYRIFYHEGKPIKKEEDLQILFSLTWLLSPSDSNREPNNGRGPVDFSISRGRLDKTLIECKLASNSKLKQNLAKQLEIYQTANQTEWGVKIIIYFSSDELQKVQEILKELGMENNKRIILIDARRENKISASNTK